MKLQRRADHPRQRPNSPSRLRRPCDPFDGSDRRIGPGAALRRSLRLRADFPFDSLPTEGALVVARALQKYGMLHADVGHVGLIAQSDRFTAARWDGLLGPRDLDAIQITDFEMIDAGPRLHRRLRPRP